MFQGRGKKRFRPETAVFHHSSKILPDLLEDVITCFLQGERVCKLCFYRRKTARIVSYKDGFPYCPDCKKCEHIWLMPASRFCENFGNFREIPVPQAPHWFMRHRDKPFGVCQKEDHHSCYERSATSDIWFAHTIEELVIWTIEREYGCTFKEYIDRYHSGRTVDSRRVGGGRQQDVFTRGDVGRGRGRPNFANAMSPHPIIRERMSLSQTELDLDDFQDSINDIYDPEKQEIVFPSIKYIPTALLEDVARCYVQGMDICKYCFYYRMEEVKKPLDSRGFSPACLRCKSHWESVKVIPASKLCRNFGNFKKVPIAIPLTRYGDEFHYCPKMNHYQCFQKFPEEGFYYTHSVEELVIWIVERETGVGYGNFGQYIKDNSLVEISGRSTATPTKSLRKSPLFDPDNCLFLSVDIIPPQLHSSIAKCFDKRINACRTCFFDSLSGFAYNNHPMLSSKEEGTKMCERGHYWRPVRVIPSSNMCKSYGTFIAIPPLPRHMQTSRSPFKVCSMADHQVCFEKTRENNPWFPHTVEEMVIWTIERETGKDYTLIYKMYILREESEDHTHETVTMETKEHVKTPNEDVKKVEEVLTSIHDNLIAAGNSSPQKDIISVVKNLAEGVQDLVSSQVSSETSTGSKVSLPGNPETTPLKFEDDLPSNGSITNLLDDDNEGCDPAGNMSLPLGEGGLTIDEASLFFPALINAGNQNNSTTKMETTPDNVNQFYTEVPPPVTTIPISLDTNIIQDVNSADNINIVQPSLIQTQPLSLQNHINPEISQGEVSTSLIDGYNSDDSDNDDNEYECYLCYREFDTPREIGHHCNKEHHLVIVKQDCHSKRSWKYYPPPPDRSPEEFKLCKKVGKCSGRLRCCKAHSLEELQEWSLRYQHRRQVAKPKSPAELVTMATMGVAMSSYNAIKVGVNPSLNEVITIGKSITWTLIIKGQAWQTLLGIHCFVTPTDTPSSLYISAIRGDTIYTVFPKSPQWVAPTYEEGILLGSISVTIKATPTVVGSHEYHVRLFTGSMEYFNIVLKISCQ